MDKLGVLASNIVNNPTLSGNINGWGGIDENGDGSSIAEYDATEKALKLPSSGNLGVRSDSFQVDPNKIYRLKFRLKKDTAHGRYYVGISAFATRTAGISGSANDVRGTEDTSGIRENRTLITAAINTYFYYEDPADTDYRDFELYILGANRSVNEFPSYTLPTGGGINSPAIQITSPETPWAAVRFLNWGNSIATNVFIRDVSVSEVGGGTIVAENITAGAIGPGTMAAENFLFTKAVGSLNKINPDVGDVRSYLGKDPAGAQADSDPVGISLEEYNGEEYETKLKAAMRSGGGVADLFVSGVSRAGA